MHTLPFRKLLLASAIGVALTACGGSDTPADPVVPVTPPPPVVEAGDTVMLTASGKLASVNLDNVLDARFFTPDADIYANLGALPGMGQRWRIALTRSF